MSFKSVMRDIDERMCEEAYGLDSFANRAAAAGLSRQVYDKVEEDVDIAALDCYRDAWIDIQNAVGEAFIHERHQGAGGHADRC